MKHTWRHFVSLYSTNILNIWNTFWTYTKQFTVYSLQFTVYSLQYTVYSLPYIEGTVCKQTWDPYIFRDMWWTSVKRACIHTHIYIYTYIELLTYVLKSIFLFTGVSKIMVTGTSLASSRDSLRLARLYPGLLYATAGSFDSLNLSPKAWNRIYNT